MKAKRVFRSDKQSDGSIFFHLSYRVKGTVLVRFTALILKGKISSYSYNLNEKCYVDMDFVYNASHFFLDSCRCFISGVSASSLTELVALGIKPIDIISAFPSDDLPF